jgi:hypothetical protein
MESNLELALDFRRRVAFHTFDFATLNPMLR